MGIGIYSISDEYTLRRCLLFLQSGRVKAPVHKLLTVSNMDDFNLLCIHYLNISQFLLCFFLLDLVFKLAVVTHLYTQTPIFHLTTTCTHLSVSSPSLPDPINTRHAFLYATGTFLSCKYYLAPDCIATGLRQIILLSLVSYLDFLV